MKTYILLSLLTIVQLASVSAAAFALPLDTVLRKTTSLSGGSIIAVEQNVIFKDGNTDYIVKEEWLIEGDKNLKLTATGVGHLKDHLKIHYLYNNKKRTQIVGKNKVVTDSTPELPEKFLAIKSIDSFYTYLKELKVAPKVRLSRAGGAISFAIGEPSTDQALSPQFWIDQDFFHLNKIRFPSEAEVEFSSYKEYGTLHYPLIKSIAWADKSATIKVTKVTIKTGASIKNFYPRSLDSPSEILLSSKGAVGQKIEDFYTRFR